MGLLAIGLFGVMPEPRSSRVKCVGWKPAALGWSSEPHPWWNAQRQQTLARMDTIVAFFSGAAGLVAGTLLAVFLAGWFLLRRNRKKLKETT